MNDSRLSSSLDALRRLNEETLSLLQTENPAQRLNKLKRLKTGLERVLSSLENQNEEVGAGKSFEDIPSIISNTLVHDWKGWSFHVESCDKFHLIHVLFSPSDQTSFCDKAVSLERDSEEPEKVGVRVIRFGEQAFSHDSVLIVDLLHALNPILSAVPVKSEPLVPVSDPWPAPVPTQTLPPEPVSPEPSEVLPFFDSPRDVLEANRLSSTPFALDRDADDNEDDAASDAENVVHRESATAPEVGPANKAGPHPVAKGTGGSQAKTAKRKVGRPKKVEVKLDPDEEDENIEDFASASTEELLASTDECRLCGALVAFAEASNHSLSAHADAPSTCLFCADNIEDDDLEEHVRLSHAPSPAFFCEFCAAGFFTDVGLEAHRRLDHGRRVGGGGSLSRGGGGGNVSSRLNACETCGKAFAFAHMLRKHKLYRHGLEGVEAEKERRKRKALDGKRGRPKTTVKEEKILMQSCRVCDQPVEYKDAFSHMANAHNRGDECPFCPGLFRKLQRHISKAHNPKPALYCEVCGACFRTHSSLKGHRLNQHFKDQKLHVCDICSTSFAFAYMLNNHKRALHEGVKTSEQPKNFLCDVCNRAFRTNELRRRHRLRVHTPELGEFVCKDCGKVMTDRQGFNNHVLIHSESRDFVCDVCSKAFRTGKNLHQHKLSHQPPKHECPYCQKKFIYACGLRSHKKQVHENPSALNSAVIAASLAENLHDVTGAGNNLSDDATSALGLHATLEATVPIVDPAQPPPPVSVPSGVITHNDLQKVMNSQEFQKVMNPGDLTLAHPLKTTNHGQLHQLELAPFRKLDAADLSALSKIDANDLARFHQHHGDTTMGNAMKVILRDSQELQQQISHQNPHLRV